jgi:hypothetical protein
LTLFSRSQRANFDIFTIPYTLYLHITVPRFVIWLTSLGYRRHVLCLCLAMNCLKHVLVRQFFTLMYPSVVHILSVVLTLCTTCGGHSSPIAAWALHDFVIFLVLTEFVA